MAYTSIIPVYRLDNSIDYIKDKEKTVRKPEPAGSLEGAIEYALDREKTEQMVYEDSVGCTCENAYADMAATKKRFHKTEGIQGYHLIQSFAAGEVTPDLAHLIGQELAEQLLKGQFEAVITTHLNTAHYHNHLVFNSVSMVDGHKYHSNSRSYYEDVRRISDGLCRKYGLSVIQTADGKGMSYAQWRAQKGGGGNPPGGPGSAWISGRRCRAASHGGSSSIRWSRKAMNGSWTGNMRHSKRRGWSGLSG